MFPAPLDGPEISTFIEAFETENRSSRVDTRHYDQTVSVQSAFVKDVRSLVDVIDELDNSFEEESEELNAFHTKQFAGSLAIKNVRKIGMTGRSSSRSISSSVWLIEPSPSTISFLATSSRYLEVLVRRLQARAENNGHL